MGQCIVVTFCISVVKVLQRTWRVEKVRRHHQQRNKSSTGQTLLCMCVGTGTRPSVIKTMKKL